jgi:uncharacterized membrane protein YhhN
MRLEAHWLVTLAFVAITLFAQRAGRRGPEGVAKAAASLGFLATAVHAGISATPHGRAVMAGLVLAWFGDVFLVSKAKGWFLAGLLAFLLGHVAYVAAFLIRGVDLRAAGVAAVILGAPALVVWRILAPRAGRLRGPVAAYITVITAMLAAAVGTFWASGGAGILAGAALFYVSDLFVARERFVTHAFWNRLVGLPIYYLGQLLLASYGGA